jgi:hypothetical protein
MSPLKTRRDYGGGILTRLHTGKGYMLRAHLYLREVKRGNGFNGAEREREIA